ncbi:MAG: hypothetical protein ACLFP2_04685 [Candidatus Woesearchaeota archaeon]
MFGFLRRKEYTAMLEGKKISVLHLKQMDKLEKSIDRNTAKLHKIFVNDVMRYVVEFKKSNGSKIYFDLPEKYARLI